MLTMTVIAEWARQHPRTQTLWRVAAARRAEVTAAGAVFRDAADILPGDTPGVAARPAPLGAHGAVSRILVALMRQQYEGPRDPARARAHADRLVETIRVLSSL
jgi:hypothetical protein